jgi:hypothetical protein
VYNLYGKNTPVAFAISESPFANSTKNSQKGPNLPTIVQGAQH